MTVALLDVNVLLGMLWRKHDFHASAMEWFLRNRESGWATCPLTQTGFVRVISNPNSYQFGPTVEEAIELLNSSIAASSDHHFWHHGLPLERWSHGLRSRIQGHKQITDAYLLALALHHKGQFVTFDRRMLQLAPNGSPERAALVILAKN